MVRTHQPIGQATHGLLKQSRKFQSYYSIRIYWSETNHSYCSAAIVKSSDTIKLIPNDGGSDIAIHRELLCFFSPYYTAALKGNFFEAQKDCLSVGVNKELLDAFVAWIYTGEIESTTRLQALEELHILLYVFADQVDVLSLRRQVIDYMTIDEAGLPYYRVVLHALTNLPETSPLRQYLLAAYIAHWHPNIDENDSYLEMREEDPSRALPDFLYQVMKGVGFRKKVDAPGCLCCNSACAYHEHESVEEWEASEFFRHYPLPHY